MGSVVFLRLVSRSTIAQVMGFTLKGEISMGWRLHGGVPGLELKRQKEKIAIQG